jgi:hypothetical protein
MSKEFIHQGLCRRLAKKGVVIVQSDQELGPHGRMTKEVNLNMDTFRSLTQPMLTHKRVKVNVVEWASGEYLVTYKFNS